MISQISIMLAFFAMFSWGVGDFLIQKVTRKVGDLETLTWIGIFGSILLIPFIWNDMRLLLIPGNFILVSVLGIVTFIAAMFNFESLREGKISVVDVVLEIELPVTVLLGFVFLGETLTTLQAIIALFILCGIMLIATKSLSHFRAKIERGVILALIASVFMGFVNFLTGVSSKEINPLMAIWAPWVVFTMICLVVILFREGPENLIKNASQNKILILSMGLLDTAAWIFYSFAVHDYEISIVTAITESFPAVALLLGVFINKEKIMKHQWIGVALALACSVLLALTVRG